MTTATATESSTQQTEDPDFDFWWNKVMEGTLAVLSLEQCVAVVSQCCGCPVLTPEGGYQHSGMKWPYNYFTPTGNIEMKDATEYFRFAYRHWLERGGVVVGRNQTREKLIEHMGWEGRDVEVFELHDDDGTHVIAYTKDDDQDE